MYHSSVLPPKQHKIPLIVSRQISITNVSPNLTDADIESVILASYLTCGPWELYNAEVGLLEKWFHICYGR